MTSIQVKDPRDLRYFVSGHRGMVGSAITRALEAAGCHDRIEATRSDLDLTNQQDTVDFVSEASPDVIVVAAAKVGGIYANDTYPAEFLYDNLMIAANLVHAAYQNGTSRLLVLGSSCIYPRMASQPMAENALLSGPLEPTNEAYSVAKIVGVKLCEFYRKQYGSNFHSLMPCNLYGIGDNYHPENSHVLPGLLRKFHEAKGSQAGSVTIWGTGTPRREFLFAYDLAEGCLHALSLEDPPSLLNIGYGSDVTVMELARLIADTVEYTGEIQLDPSKPDGVPQKLLDSSVINSLGWKPRTSLEEGLKLAYSDFCESESIRAK